MEIQYKQIPALARYIDRIGAEQLNFKRFMVKVHKGAYYIEKAIITINTDDFTVKCSNKEHEPTKEEAEAIVEALRQFEFPKSINADSVDGLLLKLRGVDRKTLFELWDRRSGALRMVQQRWMTPEGTKIYLPWSLFSDGEWRRMEPDGPLPFWKPREKLSPYVMVHEGAKAAAYCEWLVRGDDREAREARAKHPWAEELDKYEHWGLIGGAMAPHRADYAELIHEKPLELVYVADNDWPGRAVMQGFSRHYGASMKGVFFDARWPAAWDCADPLPEKMFAGGRFRGPTILSVTGPATWATEQLPNPSGSGRPITILRNAFREEWMHTVLSESFIHKDWPGRILNAAEFNSTVAPFSEVDDVAKLVRRDAASKSLKLDYLPGAPSGFYGTNDKGQFINTYCAPNIKAEDGDESPWLEFLERLIPEESDRVEVMRWVATLIARPSIKMMYGMLFISEAQGVGKSTLGEKILAPLVGFDNVSFPSETDIVDSVFNAWIAHKRLAIVNEIYAGSSAKAYNKLKSTITDRHLTVNKKHQPTYDVENWLHVFACSNSDRALKLSMDDRRWFVPGLTDRLSENSYWTGFNDWLEQKGGLGIIKRWAELWLLDNRPVLPGATAPMSRAKQLMIEEQFSPGQMLAATLLDEIKLAGEGAAQPPFITDVTIVQYIRDKLYDGRQNDKLERPSTIRRLARSLGWHSGETKTTHWSPPGTQGRILSRNREIAMRLPAALKDEGFEAFDITTLSM